MLSAPNRLANAALWAVGILLLSYTLTRAWLLSITYDEAITYLDYVRKYPLIPSGRMPWSANDHLLNTWLMKACNNLFGTSEFSLRLPNVLAHLLFLFYSAALLRTVAKGWPLFFAFLILSLNPYMLDFFSLARGYGLSLGFMMAALYYLQVYNRHKRILHSILSFTFASAAVLANFTMLQFALPLYVAILCIRFYPFGSANASLPQRVKHLLPVTVMACLLLLFVLPITFTLKEAGQLYFGGDNFLDDTVRWQILHWLYEVSYLVSVKYLFALLLASLVMASLFYTLRALRFRGDIVPFPILLLFLLLSATAISLVQHWLLQTPYLAHRTALFLTVLFTAYLAVSLAGSETKTAAWLAGTAAGICLLQFALSANSRYVLEWKSDADVKDAVNEIVRLHKPGEKFNSTVAASPEFDAGINFYRATHNLVYLNRPAAGELEGQDYFLLAPADAIKYRDKFVSVRTYPLTGNVLGKSKPGTKERTLFRIQQDFESAGTFHSLSTQISASGKHASLTNAANEYSDALSFAIPDTLPMTLPVVLSCRVKVLIEGNRKKADGYVSLNASRENAGYWQQQVSILDYVKESGKWTELCLGGTLPPSVKAGDKVSIFLWNISAENIYVDDMEMKWIVAE